MPRIPLSQVGSSKGIRFDTCIIPRMTTRFVLGIVSTRKHGKGGRGGVYICGFMTVCGVVVVLWW
jgi:hypothetical protein